MVRVERLSLAIPEGVENGLAGSPADDRLILEQRSVGFLLQRGVEGANGNHETRGFLHRGSVCSTGRIATRWRRRSAYHARAGKRVPTEAEAISVLDLAPLVLERLEVSHDGQLRGRAVCVVSRAGGWACCRARVDGGGRSTWWWGSGRRARCVCETASMGGIGGRGTGRGKTDTAPGGQRRRRIVQRLNSRSSSGQAVRGYRRRRCGQMFLP